MMAASVVCADAPPAHTLSHRVANVHAMPGLSCPSLEHDIIDEACRADAHGDGREGPAGCRRALERIELSAIVHRREAEVFEAHQGLGMYNGGSALAQRSGRALALGVGVGDRSERRVHGGRRAALLGTQVDVTRGEGQAVGLAYRLADDDVDVEVEICDETAEHDALHAVLLAKVERTRLYDVQQLRHHRRHATEEAWARRALAEGVGASEVDVRCEKCAARGRVHVEGTRGEDIVGTTRAEELDVGLERPRVLIQVLVGSELLRVDKDGDGHALMLGERETNQAEVAGVQRAHGGN
mmetsp:Transcript_51519/g.133840  ORF Transcript_51519/g.133840 Transcript_51519/m.133840 type:complete len:298 (+) Transcript_51519:546-1439(+)